MKRNRNTVLQLAFFALTATAVGCGEGGMLGETKEEKDETTEEAVNQTTFSGSKGQVAQGVPQTVRDELFGLWVGDCEPDGEGSEDEDPSYLKQSFEFRNGVKVTMGMFSDAGCDEKTMELEMHGSYLVGQESADVEGARDIDFTLVAGFVSLHAQDFVDFMNGGEACGKSDWAIGEVVAMEDLVCGEDGFLPTLGEPMPDIYKIEGNELFFGEEEQDPAVRPTELSSKPIGSKQ